MPSRPQVGVPHTQPAPGPALTSNASASRAPLWTKPVLSVYGDVRQLTMGLSPGVTESGGFKA